MSAGARREGEGEGEGEGERNAQRRAERTYSSECTPTSVINERSGVATIPGRRAAHALSGGRTERSVMRQRAKPRTSQIVYVRGASQVVSRIRRTCNGT